MFSDEVKLRESVTLRPTLKKKKKKIRTKENFRNRKSLKIIWEKISNL